MPERLYLTQTYPACFTGTSTRVVWLQIDAHRHPEKCLWAFFIGGHSDRASLSPPRPVHIPDANGAADREQVCVYGGGAYSASLSSPAVIRWPRAVCIRSITAVTQNAAMG